MQPTSLLSRRALLVTTAAMIGTGVAAKDIAGRLPWAPNAGSPPRPATPGPWQFFTPEEGALMEAIADRVIPPDPPGTANAIPGGKDAGCAVFIDRQLAGPYGAATGLYMAPPFMEGAPEQGDQSPLTPAARYRQALAAIDAHARGAYAGKPFHQLPPETQDALLRQLEHGHLTVGSQPGAKVFKFLVTDVKQGFLADPVYGGNRDMAGWRMIGFPGARYDYSDWIGRHNETYPLPPVAIGGRAAWTLQEH